MLESVGTFHFFGCSFWLNRSMIYYVDMLLVESVFLSVLFQMVLKVRAFSGWH